MNRIIIILLVMVVQGCAFTDVVLEIHEDPEASFNGPLSSIEPVNFFFTDLSDQRDDKERIGWVTNGYGAKTADITAAEPVTDLVTEAVTTALIKNGHSIGDSGRVSISGDINQFWFESDTNFWTVEFTGMIESTLTFTDNITQQTLYQSSYSGSYSEKVAAGYTRTWEKIMSGAMDSFIDDIIFDDELVEALDGIPELTNDESISLSMKNN